MEAKDIPTNKILLNNFNEKFKSEDYFNSLAEIDNEKKEEPVASPSNPEEEKKEEPKEEVKTELKLNKLSLAPLHDVLHLLGMCSKPNMESSSSPMEESSLQQNYILKISFLLLFIILIFYLIIYHSIFHFLLLLSVPPTDIKQYIIRDINGENEFSNNK